MENLQKIEKFVNGLAWFSGQSILSIAFKRQFEGFYNIASEDWENQIVIELNAKKIINQHQQSLNQHQ